MSVVVASSPQILILDPVKTMVTTVMMAAESVELVMKEENGTTPLNSFFRVSVLPWVLETSGGFPTCVTEMEEVCNNQITINSLVAQVIK